ncbi:unnamed protein product [Brachionus calyciflorus]|uniref:Protein-S-isoprenylcysteine O-methyltransferase n=1 Tax=Brachionus calyciflorus TaxID=104777 RepID=A0A814GZD0_9BILA|nr:unnamed protein product [Brachionus calyciflorus]
MSENYIHSVLLSFIPVAIIYIVYSLVSILYSPSGVWWFLMTNSIFFTGNLIALETLKSIMIYKIYWRSTLITNTFLIGFLLACQTSYPTLISFGYYLMVLSFFHLSEFVFTALFNQKEVTTDSFLLNHSKEYAIAALSSWTEFFLEALIFPSIKHNLYLRFTGLFLCLFGEFFRKLAMYTAGTNFNHFVQETRQKDHVLVTKGVYRLVRHPSYFGWFYWSIGTQILLANPICTVLYTIVTWKFFKARIIFEEYYLIRFFGAQYIQYQKKVMSGIPFVQGFVLIDETLD